MAPAHTHTYDGENEKKSIKNCKGLYTVTLNMEKAVRPKFLLCRGFAAWNDSSIVEGCETGVDYRLRDVLHLCRQVGREDAAV